MLHGFDMVAKAEAYLERELLTDDVVVGIKPLRNAAPDIRVYDARSFPPFN
ncbi:hypothetical protein [Allorhizobium taibaishanense]|uniref:Uncharacterized protein n=1 Tax=Allorhizobium taibaishanense TaxID=887144 RepID=A0A7W6HQX5_9HYPH|nr:hypothetical protein [Allorhizobium taibaishanense]MBB4009786.1 hypothetical protein [Allorhizobium taibaishanense]